MFKCWIAPSALMIAFAVAIPLAVGGREAPKYVAAVFPPWWGASSAMEAAGQAGPLAGAGMLPFLVFIAPDQRDYSARLYQAGAWLVFDPRGFIPCGSGFKERRL